MMISVREKGDFDNLERYLKKSLGLNYRAILDHYGKQGVKALEEYTPVDSGLLKDSWYYEIIEEKNALRVVWSNKDIENGYSVAMLVQYGHATKNGGYVEGQDFINPALRPIFEDLANKCWKEVTSV